MGCHAKGVLFKNRLFLVQNSDKGQQGLFFKVPHLTNWVFHRGVDLHKLFKKVQKYKLLV